MSVVPPEAAVSPTEDPVPPEVRAVIELFGNQLAKISFPDVDAGSLRRQADELRAEAKAVAHARAALDAAVATFATRMEMLTETAARAVAYARIYGDGHPDRQALVTAIAALSEPRPAMVTSAPAGKRRGRPPRQSAELFDATASAPAYQDPA
ncbi:MAG: hypothetical protein H6Q90_5614 [Deltaproteobacteria bacterium]|nr:hypothetical protein [Deltaproteobacteria bacterium]